MFEYGDLATAAVVILAAASVALLVMNLVKAARDTAAPSKAARRATEEKFEHIDKCLASDKTRIELLERQFVDSDKVSQMTLKCVMQLMEHSIDGNHIDKLREVRSEAQNYLIER